MLRWMSRSAWLPCLFAVAPSHGPESVGRTRVSVTRPGLTVHRPVDGCPRGGRSLAVGKRLRSNSPAMMRARSPMTRC